MRYIRQEAGDACAYRRSNPTRQWADIGRRFLAMADILRLIWGTIADFLRSRADLQTEIIALRHQLNVLRRKRPERPQKYAARAGCMNITTGGKALRPGTAPTFQSRYF